MALVMVSMAKWKAARADSGLAESQVGNIGHPPGGQVVDDGDGVAAGEEGLGEVRADEAGAAGDQDVTGVIDGSVCWVNWTGFTGLTG